MLKAGSIWRGTLPFLAFFALMIAWIIATGIVGYIAEPFPVAWFGWRVCG